LLHAGRNADAPNLLRLTVRCPPPALQGQDLASGNLTAPVIFALRKSEELRNIIDSEFVEEGSMERALALVGETGGIEEARLLARQQADLALTALELLPEGPARRSLRLMVDYVLERIY
jgi:all-trans-nonaprenyl-diphosphate synthase